MRVDTGGLHTKFATARVYFRKSCEPFGWFFGGVADDYFWGIFL